MTATFTPGATFANGHDLHAHAPFGETLTIVKADPQTYGNARFVVTDTRGRRMYAIARRSY